MVTFGDDHPFKFYWGSDKYLYTQVLHNIGKITLPLLVKRHCARQDI